MRPALWVYDLFFSGFFVLLCLILFFFSANVYYYCFCSWRRRGKSPAGVSAHTSVCVHVYVHVQSAAVPSAGSFVEPVSCQSYDSDPLVLIAVAGKGEERSLLPFNGHIFWPMFWPFLSSLSSGVQGLTAPGAAGPLRSALPGGGCSARSADRIPAAFAEGPRSLSQKVEMQSVTTFTCLLIVCNDFFFFFPSPRSPFRAAAP